MEITQRSNNRRVLASRAKIWGVFLKRNRGRDRSRDRGRGKHMQRDVTQQHIASRIRVPAHLCATTKVAAIKLIVAAESLVLPAADAAGLGGVGLVALNHRAPLPLYSLDLFMSVWRNL